MAAMAKMIDFDDLLASEDDEPIHTVPFKLFGREWTLVCDVNSFALAAISTGDSAAIGNFFDSIILDEEKAEFRQALSTARGLTGEKLAALVMKMIEVASERPTTPPSGSSRGAGKSTSVRKSAAS
jgi:hypothetical protein